MFFTVGPLLRQYVIVITANLSIFSTGLGLGWASPVLVLLQDETSPVLAEPVTDQEGAWIISLGMLVGMLGYAVAMSLVNVVGRKTTIAVGYIPKICAGFTYIFATEVWHLYVGRSLNACSDAIFFSIVPMYASEIASKEIRGSLGTILQVMCSLGIVAMYSFGPFVGYINLNIIFTCVTIVSFLPLLLLPDSPYFMYAKGKTTECKRVLTYLRDTDETVKAEVKDYEVMKNDKSGGFNKELLKNKIFIKGLILTLTVIFFGQSVGFNAVTFYLQTVFESTGTNISPELSAIAVGLIQLLAAFITAGIIDKFGRRIILLTTLVGKTIGMVGLATFFQVTEEAGREVTGFLNYLPLISIILYVFCYSAGVGSLMWILLAELFDGSTRAIGLPIASMGSSIFGFIVTLLFPALTNAVGAAATYYIFMANCVLGFLFVLFFIPETKGKTFLEIQVILGGKTAPVGPEKNAEP